VGIESEGRAESGREGEVKRERERGRETGKENIILVLGDRRPGSRG